jgi:hypothetical protein
MEDGSRTARRHGGDVMDDDVNRARRNAARIRPRAWPHVLELELAAARRELARLDEQLQSATSRLHAAGEQLRGANEQLDTAARENAALRAELGKERQQGDEYRRRLRELEQLNSTLIVTLGQVKGDIARAADSRAWRWGHFATTLGWRLRGRQIRTKGALAAAIGRISRAELESRGLPAPSRPPELAPARSHGRDPGAVNAAPLPLSHEDELAVERYRAALAGELRRRLGPPPERSHWPSVSVVIPTRDGRLLLERVIRGLSEHTDYPAFEVVVIDNGSSDGSLEYLEGLHTTFPLTIVSSGENGSFSEANAIGVERAGSELLLFLNNDVEPFEQGWLYELVAALDAHDVDAVGATLIHAEAAGAHQDAEPLVQHRSIALRWEEQVVRPYNAGDGEPLWDCGFGIEQRCPMVTAACMLIRRETFERVGGFDRTYRFGMEDVDLGLKLVTGGGRMAAGDEPCSSTANRQRRCVKTVTFVGPTAHTTEESFSNAGARRCCAPIASGACAGINSGPTAAHHMQRSRLPIKTRPRAGEIGTQLTNWAVRSRVRGGRSVTRSAGTTNGIRCQRTSIM